MTFYRFRDFQVPEHMMQGLSDYATYGYPPGHFLTAVICNDLAEACGRGDDENLRNLPAFVAYLVNECPPACWGSKEKMDRWIAHMAEQRELARRK
jgi:hypothetical protein